MAKPRRTNNRTDLADNPPPLQPFTQRNKNRIRPLKKLLPRDHPRLIGCLDRSRVFELCSNTDPVQLGDRAFIKIFMHIMKRCAHLFDCFDGSAALKRLDLVRHHKTLRKKIQIPRRKRHAALF